MATITARKKGGEPVSATYEMGATLQESVDLFGEKVVHELFEDALTVRIQAVIRPLIVKGKSAEEIQASLDAYKPGVTRARDTSGKISAKQLSTIEKFAAMSPEEQMAFIAQLKEKKAAADAAKAATA